MATIQKFEDMEIWQMARSLCQKIYPLTFADPIAKDFRYKDQIRGSCGSIDLDGEASLSSSTL
jgi:four helix bundle protein